MKHYDSKILFETLVHLEQLHTCVEKINRKLTEQSGLSMTSIAILFYVQKHKNVSNNKLAADIGKSSVQVSKNTRKLCDLDLLSQLTNKDDRRFIKLALTDEGQSKLKKTTVQIEKVLNNMDISETIDLIMKLSVLVADEFQ